MSQIPESRYQPLKPWSVAFFVAVAVQVSAVLLDEIEIAGPFHGLSEISRAIWNPVIYLVAGIDFLTSGGLRIRSGPVLDVISYGICLVINFAFWMVAARLAIAFAQWLSTMSLPDAALSRRAFGVLLPAIVAGILLMLMAAAYDRVRWVNYLRIESGMTPAQVRSVLGWDLRWHPADGPICFEGRRAVIYVEYSGSLVRSVSYMSR